MNPLRKLVLDQPDATATIEAVTVPEWTGPDGKPVVVHVRAISGAERDRFEEESLVKRGKSRETSLRNLRARLVVLAACVGPNDANQLFAADDVALLGRKSAKALDRLYEAAARLAGIRDDDVEELLGNSEPGPSAGSGSS